MNQIAKTFAELNSCWEQLSDKSIYTYKLGNNMLRLHVAGQSLKLVMTDAFSHLSANHDAVPELTVRVWDGKEQKLALPSFNWQKLHANGYRGYFEGAYYFHYFESIGALSFLNLEENLAYYIIRDAHALPWWVRGSPLQVILGVWFRARGSQLTHVGAVGDEANCVLLAGKGGSGKTTTTLSCIIGGLNYLGEDYCLLTPDKIPMVHSVYQSAKWTPQTRKLYPEYESFVVNKSSTPSEKSLLFYRELFPERIRAALQARAIISLSVGDALQPSIIQTDIETSLKNLSLSTIHQLPFFDQKTLILLKKFAEAVPHYQLQLGHDYSANVRVIKMLLAGFR